jgi:putative oxidoreductase
MLNHIGPTQIFGALVLVVALYYMRTWLSRHALRGWRESHPHALAWMRRYHLLIELTEVSLAAVFFLVGGAKLIGRHDMIVLFEDIGVGQWLRYLTGTLEVSGAALLLVPLLSGPSSVALGGIMVVATLIELFVLHRPPVAALACLSGHTFVAWARLSQSRGRAISAPGGASVVRTAENDGGALGLPRRSEPQRQARHSFTSHSTLGAPRR